MELREIPRWREKEKERGGEGWLLTMPMDSSSLSPSVVSKTTRASSSQYMKALSPILVTEAGMVNSVKPSAS